MGRGPDLPSKGNRDVGRSTFADGWEAALSTSEIHPSDVTAFADSATFFGYDRKQTRLFLEAVAARLAELERTVEELRGRELQVGDALIVATSVARWIEGEAHARAEAIEEESNMARGLLVAELERADAGLDELLSALRRASHDPEAARRESILHLGNGSK